MGHCNTAGVGMSTGAAIGRRLSADSRSSQATQEAAPRHPRAAQQARLRSKSATGSQNGR
jgi:hypothetical protein